MKKTLVVRILRRCIWTLLSLVLFYLVAANVFLSTSLFDRFANAKPETIAIHFERAWSLFPGHIHAKKIWVRGRDSNVEWILRFDEVDCQVSLLGFTERRFRASSVHAKGTQFRLRQRLESEPTSPDEWAGLPPIEGLPPTPSARRGNRHPSPAQIPRSPPVDHSRHRHLLRGHA